jgi:hypothetical protein
MRVQSNRPSKGEAGGWLHPLDTDRVELPPKEPKKPTIDAAQIISDWAERTKAEWVQAFAKQLGVSYTALACLGCCWSPGHRAWAFPMKDGHERTVGIRLRSVDGKKWAVPGSHAGLFIPQTKCNNTGYICEGPTDTAAAVSLGVFAIGRPSCQGGVAHITTLFTRKQIVRAVIMCDNDKPGLIGASRLQGELKIPSCIMVPPTKDVREFLGMGGDQTLLNSLLAPLVWRQPC